MLTMLRSLGLTAVTLTLFNPVYAQAQQSSGTLPSATSGLPNPDPMLQASASNSLIRDIQAVVVPSDRLERELFRAGTIATSGFSGTVNRKPKFADKLTKEQLRVLENSDYYKFIDLNGYATTLLTVDRLKHTYNGSEVQQRPYDQVLARDVGQVFGLAFDQEEFPNLYMTATSAFGLQIVGGDANEDRVPDRLLVGGEAAFWMNGQWGSDPASGPGSIYKLDGETGQISLFANVQLNGRDNSGAGLGNIAYDVRHEQLFVSDLETGLIHRLNLEGQDLEQFDHGVLGLPAEDRDPVLFDPETKLDIKSDTFDPFDAQTWNMATPARRIWGLAVRSGRLYYATADGPEVWSVGLDRKTGGFLKDARWELTVSDAHPDFDISDIVFSTRGTMILAQRGGQTASFDYSTMAEPEKAEVLKYTREYPEDDPDTPSIWYPEPVVQPVGFFKENRNGLGGVALGPAYDEKGRMDWRNCRGSLWSTGERLRVDDDLRVPLLKGGMQEVDGLQAVPLIYPVKDNVPPWLSYYHDYDGEAPTDEEIGQIGDVEILGCRGSGKGRIAESPPRGIGAPKTFPPQVNLPPTVGDPSFWCTKGVLQAGVCLCALFPNKCFPSTPEKAECATVTPTVVCNKSTGTYELQATLDDKSGGNLDAVKLSDPTSVLAGLPRSQAYPGPMNVDLTGMLAGQTGQINVCAYNAADAQSGQPYSCCNTTVSFKIPGEACSGEPQ